MLALNVGTCMELKSYTIHTNIFSLTVSTIFLKREKLLMFFDKTLQIQCEQHN